MSKLQKAIVINGAILLGLILMYVIGSPMTSLIIGGSAVFVLANIANFIPKR